jgi:hypothetical protein|nr:MAG TPA: hypothetical protein [Caudoviricetes sp.]
MAEYVTKEQVVEWFRPYGHAGDGIPYDVLAADIREMPAVDAVPVVRCGGCEYSLSYCGYLVCSLSARSRNPKANYIVNPDFFCAHGKRKEPT